VDINSFQIVLLKCATEKDVFQMFYTAKLARRLVYNLSLSETAEASMIFKLKEVFPFKYTNKVQHMFTDMNLSKDLTQKFKSHTEQSGDMMGGNITFDVTVLATNFWPLRAPDFEFVVPREILPTYDRFTLYYQNQHMGRKLTWLWNYSRHHLRAYYLNQKYILMTSSYQMAVLVQYNTNLTLSLDELIGSTGIPKDLLVPILALLVRMKILVTEETDQYDLNFKFTSKKVCSFLSTIVF
jgi:cullin 1